MANKHASNGDRLPSEEVRTARSSMGGHARAKALSPSARVNQARKAALVRARKQYLLKQASNLVGRKIKIEEEKLRRTAARLLSEQASKVA